MPDLGWLTLALDDLLGIIDYISDDNPNAAQGVKDDIKAKVENLKSFPKMGRPGQIEGTRELVTLRNYIVVYQECSVVIKILRVLHAHQQWPPLSVN